MSDEHSQASDAVNGGRVAVVVVALLANACLYLQHAPGNAFYLAIIALVSLIICVGMAFDARRAVIAFTFLAPLLGSFHQYLGVDDNPPLMYLILPLVAGYNLWLTRDVAQPWKASSTRWLGGALICFAVVSVLSGAIAIVRFWSGSPSAPFEIHNYIVSAQTSRHFLADAARASRYITQFTLNYASFAFLFLIYRRLIDGPGQRRRLVCALATGVMLASIVGVIQITTGALISVNEFWIAIDRVINATFDDPNTMGLFLGFTLPVVIAAALGARGVWRGVWLVSTIPGLVCLIYSGSRSGVLCFIVALVLFAWLARRTHDEKPAGVEPRSKARRLVPVAVALGVIVLVAVGGFFAVRGYEGNNPLLRRLSADAQALDGGDGVSTVVIRSRGLFWREAAHMTRDFPLAGVGVGAYVSQLYNYYVLDDVPKEDRFIDAAGSVFFHMAAELGLPGLVMVTLILVGVIAMLLRARGDLRGSMSRADHLVYVGGAASVTAMIASMAFGMHTLFFSIAIVFWGLIGASARTIDDIGAPEPLWANRWSTLLCALLGAVIVVASVAYGFGGLNTESMRRRVGWAGYYGMGQPEYAPDEDERGWLMWLERRAGIAIPADYPVIGLRVRAPHPDVVERPVSVRVTCDGALLDIIDLTSNETVEIPYALPIRVGKEFWLRFEASRDWSPSDDGHADTRRFGLAFFPYRQLRDAPDDGFGFHAWEADEEGRRFRWMRACGAVPIPPDATTARFTLQIDKPGLERKPISVSVHVNDAQVETIRIDRKNRGERIAVTVDLDTSEVTNDKGREQPLLILMANRMWRPVDVGFGDDNRRFSVQVGEIVFE